MSPAASIFFNTIPQAQAVGGAIPFCYLVGFIVALLVANQYSEFTRELPSSGSAYTYVTEGLGPRLGFLTGWIGLGGIAFGIPYSFVLLSANLHDLMILWFGLNLHWSFWFVLTLGIAFTVCYLGVRESMNVDLTFLVVEITICLILAALIFFHVGQQGGLTLQPFNPAIAPASGRLLPAGIILATLSFIGFETAATLGEETRDPHRHIPRAVLGSLIVVGLFYILMAYAATVGYGINHMATGYATDAAPFDTLGRKFANPFFATLLDLVGIFSFFSAAVAILNGGSRIIYTVGKDGLLPAWTARLHPKRHTPVGPLIALCIFGLIVGLLLGFLMTPLTAFGFLGTLDALFILLIYALTSVACITFFRRKRKDQFNFFRHGLLPILSALLTFAIFVLVLTNPGDPPLTLVPLVLFIFIVPGLVLMFLLRTKPAVGA
jgi:amino acid transporter